MKKCYIYTRVSTAAQVDGYSLEAQLEELHGYAKYRELKITREYCDAGKSGKSIKGRPQFQQMMDDVISQKDDIAYVLVFKLSRFGRNAADILKSLQVLQDYGIDLVSVNESIDSSTQGGRLTLAVLSAVAEMERENIMVQFMSGKLQKIMNGGWGGGPVPYGYRVEDGVLIQYKEEADVVRKIYDLYMHKDVGANTIVRYLNDNGYVRKKDGPKEMSVFTYPSVIDVLDNPFYCGRIIYNRRTNKKDRNGEKIIKDPDELISVMGVHEPIISEEVWERAHAKREALADARKNASAPERVNLLSGLVRCPVCGCRMIANHNHKRNKQTGKSYGVLHYYTCENSRNQNGKICSFRHAYNQEKVDAAVFELIGRVKMIPSFQKAITDTLGDADSITKAEEHLQSLRKDLRSCEVRKQKLGEQLDGLNPDSRSYNQKYEAIQEQLEHAYEDIDQLDAEVHKAADTLENAKVRLRSAESVLRLLDHMPKLYGHMSGEERRQMCRLLIERIDVFPEDRADGKIIRSISFKFPVWYGNGKLDIEKAPDEKVSYVLDCSKAAPTAAEAKATYTQISSYVKETSDLKVSTLYIAQIKSKYGLETRRAYNKHEETESRVPRCPKEKEAAIMDALKHFKMLDRSVKYKEGE